MFKNSPVAVQLVPSQEAFMAEKNNEKPKDRRFSR
jgi:hypothetical protein